MLSLGTLIEGRIGGGFPSGDMALLALGHWSSTVRETRSLRMPGLSGVDMHLLRTGLSLPWASVRWCGCFPGVAGGCMFAHDREGAC